MSGAVKVVPGGTGPNIIPATEGQAAVILADDVDISGNAVTMAKETRQALAVRDPEVTDVQYATNALTSSSPKDATMAAKLELQGQSGLGPGVTPFGMLVAKDSDFKWLQKKKEKDAEAQFQQWFALNFDKMSPEQKQMARELWPEFYQQRLQLADKDIEMIGRLAKLNITGIKNRGDLLLQYAKEAGYIDTDRLDNILHPENSKRQSAAARQANFTRGLLNPKRLPVGFFSGQTRMANAKEALNRTLAPSAADPAKQMSAFGPLASTAESRSRYGDLFTTVTDGQI